MSQTPDSAVRQYIEQHRAAFLDDLAQWLRIPSVSAQPVHAADVRRSAEFCGELLREAGLENVALLETAGAPSVYGEWLGAGPGAPTALVYGHHDVQPVDPLDEWTSPPFEPALRDGRVYARGASDDKGDFLPLLLTACELAAAGELPVHVRVLVEGEEEVGSAFCSRWIAADERGADAAIVFDSGMVDERTPAITVGLRGAVLLSVAVRVAPRDLHSGMYGGTVLNALHVLGRMLVEVLPGPDGRLREELRAGDAVLVKASRGARLDEVAAALQ
jgi:acetylornithine deacetylase/succinyl-diaminopimelate desuccinylase-like protein